METYWGTPHDYGNPYVNTKPTMMTLLGRQVKDPEGEKRPALLGSFRKAGNELGSVWAIHIP